MVLLAVMAAIAATVAPLQLELSLLLAVEAARMGSSEAERVLEADLGLLARPVEQLDLDRPGPVSFDAGGTSLAVVEHRGDLSVVDLATGSKRPVATESRVHALDLTGDGRRLAIGSDDAVRLIEFPSGSELERFPTEAHTHRVADATY